MDQWCVSPILQTWPCKYSYNSWMKWKCWMRFVLIQGLVCDKCFSAQSLQLNISVTTRAKYVEFTLVEWKCISLQDLSLFVTFPLWWPFANWEPIISGIFAGFLLVPAGENIVNTTNVDYMGNTKPVSVSFSEIIQRKTAASVRLLPLTFLHLWIRQHSGRTKSKVNLTLLATHTHTQRRVSYQSQREAQAVWCGRWDCVE